MVASRLKAELDSVLPLVSEWVERMEREEYGEAAQLNNRVEDPQYPFGHLLAWLAWIACVCDQVSAFRETETLTQCYLCRRPEAEAAQMIIGPYARVCDVCVRELLPEAKVKMDSEGRCWLCGRPARSDELLSRPGEIASICGTCLVHSSWALEASSGTNSAEGGEE